MSSPYIFGAGPCHLSVAVAVAVNREGAELVNYTEPHGIKRHWFVAGAAMAAPPFAASLARRVRAAVERVATAADRRALKLSL